MFNGLYSLITFSGKQGISVTLNKVSNVEISDDQIRLAKGDIIGQRYSWAQKLGNAHIRDRLRRPNQTQIGQGLGT